MFIHSLSIQELTTSWADHCSFSSGTGSGFQRIPSGFNEVPDHELQETQNLLVIEVLALTAHHLSGSCSQFQHHLQFLSGSHPYLQTANPTSIPWCIKHRLWLLNPCFKRQWQGNFECPPLPQQTYANSFNFFLAKTENTFCCVTILIPHDQSIVLF